MKLLILNLVLRYWRSTGWPSQKTEPINFLKVNKKVYGFCFLGGSTCRSPKIKQNILILYTRTSGHVGEYYGPNFSCTEYTSYPEKKEKARIKFMNFSQKYMGPVFFGGGSPCIYLNFVNLSFSLAMMLAKTFQTLFIRPYHPSFHAGLPDYILSPHRSVGGKFLLIDQHWHVHINGPVGEHPLWVCPCFSSSVLHVLFVLLGWF